ncbi:hypothetical protein [Streptomyces asiaticus]
MRPRAPGAGGAGRAIAAALLAAGVERLSVCDLDVARLGGLRSRLDTHWPGMTATSTEPDLDGADIVMKPRETRLLREAASLGHPVHYGIRMLDGQVASYRAFFGLG